MALDRNSRAHAEEYGLYREIRLSAGLSLKSSDTLPSTAAVKRQGDAFVSGVKYVDVEACVVSMML